MTTTDQQVCGFFVLKNAGNRVVLQKNTKTQGRQRRRERKDAGKAGTQRILLITIFKN